MIRVRRILLCLTLSTILLFAACKDDEGSKSSAVHTVDAWSLQILNWESTARLNATRAVEHYNGMLENVAHEEIPKEGHVFLLIELTLEKMNSGNSTFDWERLCIEDPKGSQYRRHPNDSFLSLYKLPRIKAVPLSFGKNSGYICFEIPESETKNTLTLVYDGTERIIRIPLVP